MPSNSSNFVFNYKFVVFFFFLIFNVFSFCIYFCVFNFFFSLSCFHFPKTGCLYFLYKSVVRGDSCYPATQNLRYNPILLGWSEGISKFFSFFFFFVSENIEFSVSLKNFLFSSFYVDYDENFVCLSSILIFERICFVYFELG